jgi:hypothetical protein
MTGAFVVSDVDRTILIANWLNEVNVVPLELV